MSQGSLAKKATSLSIPLASLKFPPITSMSYSTTRSKDWDDILTAHSEETFARSWTMLNKKLGKHNFGFNDAVKGKAKERPVLGSVKVLTIFQNMYMELIDDRLGLLGSMCHCVWQLWPSEFIYRWYSYVEHAIGHSTQDFRCRIMSTRSKASLVQGEMCNRPCNRRTQSYCYCKYI